MTGQNNTCASLDEQVVQIQTPTREDRGLTLRANTKVANAPVFSCLGYSTTLSHLCLHLDRTARKSCLLEVCLQIHRKRIRRCFWKWVEIFGRDWQCIRKVGAVTYLIPICGRPWLNVFDWLRDFCRKTVPTGWNGLMFLRHTLFGDGITACRCERQHHWSTPDLFACFNTFPD